MHLEEKEKREKEMRIQIIEEAGVYIQAFYEKRKLNVETNIANNREREKVKFPKKFHFSEFLYLLYWAQYLDVGFVYGAVILGQSREIS